MGYLSYDNVLSLLQNSDIFVLPSYYEALGCVYLEAMSCGVPVIGCINNGIDEIIQNGVDGFLIEGKNVEGIVESIKKMIREKRYKEMGILARQHVEENYSWMNSASRLIMIYKKILNCWDRNLKMITLKMKDNFYTYERVIFPEQQIKSDADVIRYIDVYKRQEL